MYLKLKRLCDVCSATILLLLLAPVMLAVSILVFIEVGYPIIFKQQRVGKDNKIFTIYKFRTMNNKVDSKGELLPDMQRLTKSGAVIRRFSLDELPQLINILKGDMSFIGPRPLLVEYLPLYSAKQIRRHEVAPGISGLAQVRGRNCTTWKKRFEYDVYYVENIGLILDTMIFFLTIKEVIQPSGVNTDKNNTMSKFTGEA